MPHPMVFPCRPSLFSFQWGDVKERIITLDTSCQFSLNLFISYRVSLEGYTHGRPTFCFPQTEEERPLAALTIFLHWAFLYCNKRGGDNSLPNPDKRNPVLTASLSVFFLSGCFALNSVSSSVSSIKFWISISYRNKLTLTKKVTYTLGDLEEGQLPP